ncbi:HupE/UreJ family protein [Belnapia sp. T6]|uniref:HupE/UreJ family protein n=1 Tax=Belnapia mucosa TaxID=2804532 RepID=A0ABS1VAL4_9PROT|nr:HupE/UreJ family protein [Belnapia mucosa]MBL6458717.1 HupE/UreJ family protein [Belnapia mucosa]
MNPIILFATALLLPATAFAHPGMALDHGLMAGLLHPFSGADHLLAMVMVGLWAGLLGGRARIALPGGFLAGMAGGALLGFAGLALPGVEAGILASVIILGALAALSLRLPLVLGTLLAVGFGLLHGHAHGTEMLGAPAFLGMLAGTAALHGAGLALSAAAQPWARRAAQLAGGATALAGLALALV